ncbi:15719_t:CDS:1, partial [Cetraspora pellucida]
GQQHPIARLWNISDNEVYNSLITEKELIIADIILQPLLDKYSTSFGGSYINMAERCITVYTIDTGKIDIIKSLMGRNKRLLSFKRARRNRSLQELRDQFNRMVNLAIEYRTNIYNKLQVFIYTDMRANNNIVELDRDVNARAFADSIKIYKPILRMTTAPPVNSKRQNKVSIRDISDMVLSGEGLCDYNYAPCTIGFWAKDRRNIDYIVTAGHCIIESSTSIFISTDFYHVPKTINAGLKFLGKSVMARIEPFDFGLIQVMGTEFQLSANIIKNIAYSQYPQLYIRRNLKVSCHGIHICKVGSNTHLSCGFIKALNGIFITEKGIMSNMIISTLYSLAGDSGGPSFVFSAFSQDLRSVDLVGIHIGGNGVNLAFALPIDSILRSADIRVVSAYR